MSSWWSMWKRDPGSRRSTMSGWPRHSRRSALRSPPSVCSSIGSNGPQAIPPKNLSRSVRSTNVWNSAAAASAGRAIWNRMSCGSCRPWRRKPGPSRPLQSVARGPKSSRRTGPETEVTFVNRTGGPVELFWLDSDGKRRSYGRLQVDEERSQHTFAGHVWLLVDGAGEPLGVCVARERPMSVDVSRVLDSSDEKDTAESEEWDDDDRQRTSKCPVVAGTHPPTVNGRLSSGTTTCGSGIQTSGEEFAAQLRRHFGRRLRRSILLVARFDHAGCRAHPSG